MKRALFAIASVAIVATAVRMEAANAQYAPAPPAYSPSPTYAPCCRVKARLGNAQWNTKV